jgi:hypothetical protein
VSNDEPQPASLSGIPFRWSDAWLLLSIAWASRGGTAAAALDEVIAAGDALNHAIFTFEEVDGGVARLSVADLIAVVDQRVQLTKAGKDLCDRMARPTAWDALTSIAQELGVPEPHDGNALHVDPSWTSKVFSEEQLGAAYERYRHHVRAAYRG